jgi:uncharacterized protein YidB (DUF937 family)
MSLLKTLLTFAGGALLGPKAGALLTSVIGMLENSTTQAAGGTGGGLGGLGGLLNNLKQNGLGDQVASWISTGQNQPVAPDQLQNAMGGQIGQLAQSLGINPQDVSKVLSEWLPALIDKLTPDGKVPDDHTLAQHLADLKAQIQEGGHV